MGGPEFICRRHGGDLVGCGPCRDERRREWSDRALAAGAKRSAAHAALKEGERAVRLRTFPLFVNAFSALVSMYQHVGRLPLPPLPPSHPRKPRSTFAGRPAARREAASRRLAQRLLLRRLLIDILCALAPQALSAIPSWPDDPLPMQQQPLPQRRTMPPREPFWGTWREVPLRFMHRQVLRDIPCDIERHSRVGDVADLDAIPFAIRDRSRVDEYE